MVMPPFVYLSLPSSHFISFHFSRLILRGLSSVFPTRVRVAAIFPISSWVGRIFRHFNSLFQHDENSVDNKFVAFISAEFLFRVLPGNILVPFPALFFFYFFFIFTFLVHFSPSPGKNSFCLLPAPGFSWSGKGCQAGIESGCRTASWRTNQWTTELRRTLTKLGRTPLVLGPHATMHPEWATPHPTVLLYATPTELSSTLSYATPSDSLYAKYWGWQNRELSFF
jgi:hypothetical protein